MKRIVFGVLGLFLSACYNPERNCETFREGTFDFTTVLENTEQTTRFTRSENLETSNFQGVTDSASVRWINNCEYILTNLNPKSKAEEKPIHIKILSTTSNSYTFEYKLVGTSSSRRGTAIKIN
jgi:hypothetical protein